MTNLQTFGFENGFAVADLGATGKKLWGFRYQLSRLSDRAVFRARTQKEVKELIAYYA